MAPVSAAIDWGDILQVLWAAPLAGIGVTVLFSLGLYGSTRAAEASREKRRGDFTRYSLLALFGFAVFAAAILFGIWVILDT